MARLSVIKIKSKRHLLASSTRLHELNDLRLTRLLTSEEEGERQALDRGIKFYVLAKMRGRQGFRSFNSYDEMVQFLKDLSLIFDSDYITSLSGYWVIQGLVNMGFTIRLDYNPAHAQITFDLPRKEEGE